MKAHGRVIVQIRCAKAEPLLALIGTHSRFVASIAPRSGVLRGAVFST